MTWIQVVWLVLFGGFVSAMFDWFDCDGRECCEILCLVRVGLSLRLYWNLWWIRLYWVWLFDWCCYVSDLMFFFNYYMQRFSHSIQINLIVSIEFFFNDSINPCNADDHYSSYSWKFWSAKDWNLKKYYKY